MVINNMCKIFISYSREDQLFARSICFALREAGGEVWYDEHDIDTGRLTPSIEGALQISNILVLLLSASALASAWVSREVSWFCQLQKIDPSRQIVPVMVREVDPAEIWPSVQDFVRIEGPRGAPLPHDKAILRLLSVLGLARFPLPDDGLVRARFGESAADLYENAMALYKRGLAADALPLMKRAAELSTDRSERFRSWASLGIVQQALNRLDDALRSFDRALAIFDDAQTWFNKSIALERFGRLAEAVDANDAALRLASAALDESNENYWGHYGHLLYRQKRYLEAAQAFEWLIYYHPESEAAALHFSSALTFVEGLEHSAYEKGLDKISFYRAGHPEDLQGLLVESELLRQLKRTSDAFDLLDANQHSFESSSEYWKFKGATLADMAQQSQSRSAYLKALEYDTSNEAFLWGLIAESYVAEGDNVNALAATERSLSAGKTSAGFGMKGSILQKLDQLTEAVVAYEQALVLDGMNNPARVNLAIILKRLGRFSEALTTCDQVLETELNTANRDLVAKLKLEIEKARGRAGKEDEEIAQDSP